MGSCQQATGQCACNNQAWGLRCQVPGSIQPNQGGCQVNNPCRRGLCYDMGAGAACECPDGYYGRLCQFRMVSVECHRLGMVINVFPYGFDPGVWVFLDPPSTKLCPLQTIPSFVARYPTYRQRGWNGFAGAFYHRNDRCGNARVTETATEIKYSRDLFVYYGMNGRDPTDNAYRVICTFRKPAPVTTTPPPQQPVLPPPQIVYTLVNQRGQRLQGPIRLGQTVGVVFTLRPVPNNADMTDLSVESCVLTDGRSINRILVVNNRCAVGPIGRLLYKPRDRLGVSLLVMTIYRFPGTSSNLNFQCRVRMCKSTDMTCRRPVSCPARGRRSVSRSLTMEADDNHYIVSVPLTP
ncbi:hypothetical protein BaRGS_00029952 [Batillaria attramentaria]|uniref:ZP domain-containing protein n=1 Tax=Batillaria attramentaria TaxID=370345 RepID=A0ABD0JVH0_9CAEN